MREERWACQGKNTHESDEKKNGCCRRQRRATKKWGERRRSKHGPGETTAHLCLPHTQRTRETREEIKKTRACWENSDSARVRQDLRERSTGLRGNTTGYNTSATVPPTPRILPRPPKPKVAKPTPKHPTDPALVPDMYSDAHSCLWHIKITVGVHKPHSTCQGSTKVIGHAARSRLLHVSAWRPPVPSAAKRRMPTALRKGCLLFSVAAPPRSQSRSSGSTSVQQKQKYRPGG